MSLKPHRTNQLKLTPTTGHSRLLLSHTLTLPPLPAHYINTHTQRRVSSQPWRVGTKTQHSNLTSSPSHQRFTISLFFSLIYYKSSQLFLFSLPFFCYGCRFILTSFVLSSTLLWIYIFLGQWENRPTFSLLCLGFNCFDEKNGCLVARGKEKGLKFLLFGTQ